MTRGHPESPLRWTCKSTRQLAEELTRQNHPVSDRTVARLLYDMGYSLQAGRSLCCTFDVDEDYEIPDELDFCLEFITVNGKRFRHKFSPQPPEHQKVGKDRPQSQNDALKVG